ncbi:helix-turn-helix domain-containing protein [Streptomyces buecherae]|uniref:helix-turn-helix domain-containing protein n=1 Tax=Streptomyces buecherae TaxID=2763006 RepID=UPI001C2695C7|nr:helix-turn-helix domain-containing protein [Streptomyces buecherae]
MEHVEKVSRVLAVLERQTRPTITQLAVESGIPQTTVRALVRAMVEKGLLVQEDGRYYVGPQMMRVADAASDLYKVASPTAVLTSLLVDTGATAAQLYRQCAPTSQVCIDQSLAQHASTRAFLGQRMPIAPGPIATVMLAWAPRDAPQTALRARVPLTDTTLRRAREAGWVQAVVGTGQSTAVLAAPVLRGSTLVSVLTISGPTSALSRRPGDRHGNLLATAALKIGRCSPPPR